MRDTDLYRQLLGLEGVRQVRVSWAEPKARFTALFERFAIDVLLETSIAGATTIQRISWDEEGQRPAVPWAVAGQGAALRDDGLRPRARTRN